MVEIEMVSDRPVYAAPFLKVYGSAVTLTAGGSGVDTEPTFSVGPPKVCGSGGNGGSAKKNRC